MPSLSPVILSIVAPFALLFSRPVWGKALTLLVGTILCRGKRIDPEEELDPVPLMSTDLTFSAEKMILFYIRRWNLEVTFEEVREHLGVETQRQWSDKAIVRTTPILMGLYTIVCLVCNRRQEERPIEVAQTAWYEKTDATFSD